MSNHWVQIGIGLCGFHFKTNVCCGILLFTLIFIKLVGYSVGCDNVGKINKDLE